MSEEDFGTVKPTLGRIVIYTSRNGDGVESPAVVLRTKETTNLDIINRWQVAEDSLSNTGKPADLVPELPDDYTVDLLVHGLGGDYREFAVKYSNGSMLTRNGQHFSRTWHWPERV